MGGRHINQESAFQSGNQPRGNSTSSPQTDTLTTFHQESVDNSGPIVTLPCLPHELIEISGFQIWIAFLASEIVKLPSERVGLLVNKLKIDADLSQDLASRIVNLVKNEYTDARQINR
jgi:hypothetical protein